MVRPGAVQWVIAERQDGQRRLHAVSEGAGGAIPGEPRAHLTKILHTHTTQTNSFCGLIIITIIIINAI